MTVDKKLFDSFIKEIWMFYRLALPEKYTVSLYYKKLKNLTVSKQALKSIYDEITNFYEYPPRNFTKAFQDAYFNFKKKAKTENYSKTTKCPDCKGMGYFKYWEYIPAIGKKCVVTAACSNCDNYKSVWPNPDKNIVFYSKKQLLEMGFEIIGEDYGARGRYDGPCFTEGIGERF